MKKIIYILSVTILSSVLCQCARRGSPSGGPKDETPPVLLSAIPKSGQVNFNHKKIRLVFDELVTTKDLRKQLIISPPMDNFPIFSPISASKWLEIRILDTLKPNTTYVFNFGNSLQDYNEGNPYTDLKYVFSTGQYIDSLKVSGKIKDAVKPKHDNFVTLMLYEMNEKYTDSIVFKSKPTYITNTLDSLDTFQLNYIKEGKYTLIALKDKNNNYIFDQKEDKIGFIDSPISIGKDSIHNIEMTLFKEIPNYKVARPSQVAENRISFGFEGDFKNVEIKPISPLPADFKHITSKEPKKDTLNFWFNAKRPDSLLFAVKNNARIDTLKVRLRKMKQDSLQITPSFSGDLPMNTHFHWAMNIPIVKTDETKIKIINKDSVSVPFKMNLDDNKLNISLIFDKKYNETYHIQALPKAFEDFFGKANDTLNVQLKTKKLEEFSILKLTINKKLNFPIIIQLTDEKSSEVYREMYIEKAENQYVIKDIDPKKYALRIIEDANKNKKWDTGNFLKRLQPERIIHYPKTIELRANWEIEEVWNE